jgi:Flp pilus assembly pilin Flp
MRTTVPAPPQWKRPRRRSERNDGELGQTLVEYALIVALVALAAIVALGFMSGRISALFSKAGNSVNGVTVAEAVGGGPPPPPPPSPPADGTVVTAGNTTSQNNALLALFYGANTAQRCTTNTGICAIGGGTWATITVPSLYSIGRSGACSVTFTNGYSLSGTWTDGYYRRVGDLIPLTFDACL